MIYLILSILSSTMIFVTFKVSEKYSGRLFNLIVINYLTATLLGLVVLLKFRVGIEDFRSPWMLYSVVVGLLFIVIFFLIGKSSLKAGIAVTTVAGKMSTAIPVLFSIIYFSETLTILKITGIVLALAAVFMVVYKKGCKSVKNLTVLLPILIFAGSGLVDSLVKFAQQLKIPDGKTPEFTTFVFLTALLSGLFVDIFRPHGLKYYFHPPTLLSGIILGLVNFSSLFFIIKALNYSNLDSSLVFAVNNTSIVILSSLAGFYIFKENLSRLNIAGIIVAFISIYLLTGF